MATTSDVDCAPFASFADCIAVTVGRLGGFRTGWATCTDAGAAAGAPHSAGSCWAASVLTSAVGDFASAGAEAADEGCAMSLSFGVDELLVLEELLVLVELSSGLLFGE